jgi:capsular exopolysaccharide synthesis family protein
MKLKLEDSERKLVAVAQKEQIVGNDDQTGNLSQQNLSSLNVALTQARADRIKAESRWAQAQTSSGVALMVDQSSNSIIKTLQESRANLMSDYQQKLSLYKPAYPLMVQLKSQIDEVDKQIAAETGKIRSSIQAEYLAAAEQERLLTEQLNSVKGEALDLQTRSIQYTILKREVDTNRQLYDSLLKQYKEIGISSGVSNNNISIVDRAERGSKFKPSLGGNLSLGLFFGLLLGVVLALGIEYLDDTLKSPEDVEQHLGLPVLGVIPKLKDPMTPLRALEDPRCAFAESYRSLRTALQFSTNNGTPRCLLVTSASPKEGKSTSAIVLAQNFAQLGKTVLLIDCDLRNPSLHKQLGVANTSGLTNYLAGAAKPEEVISTTQIHNLMVIPSGPLPPNPAELLLGPKMISLLTVAIRKFDQVILDGPPIMGLADAPILANMASGTLMVVESGETITVKARDALKRVWSTRAHVVGVLLTKFEAHHASYGYGYGDYNYYTYGGKAPAKLTKS